MKLHTSLIVLCKSYSVTTPQSKVSQGSIHKRQP